MRLLLNKVLRYFCLLLSDFNVEKYFYLKLGDFKICFIDKKVVLISDYVFIDFVSV